MHAVRWLLTGYAACVAEKYDARKLSAQYCGGRYVERVEMDEPEVEPESKAPAPRIDVQRLLAEAPQRLKPIPAYGKRRDRR